jgi:hypothetical protein
MREQGYEALEQAIGGDAFVGVGTPTLVETAIVLHARVGVLPEPCSNDSSMTPRRLPSLSAIATGRSLSARSPVTGEAGIRRS